MPLEGWLPLAMAAPMSASESWIRFFRRCAEQFFQQIVAPANAQFLGHHPQRVLRSHKMNAGHALIRLQRAQQLTAKDCAGCAGECDGEVYGLHFIAHVSHYSLVVAQALHEHCLDHTDLSRGTWSDEYH